MTILRLTLLDAKMECATINLEVLLFELPFLECHSSNKPKTKTTKVNCCMAKASCANVKQRHKEYMYMPSYVKTSFETKG